MWNSNRNDFHVYMWLVAPICCHPWSKSWSRNSNGSTIWFDRHQMSPVKIPQEIPGRTNTATFTCIPAQTSNPNAWFSERSMHCCKMVAIRNPQRNLWSPYMWITVDFLSNVGSKPGGALKFWDSSLQLREFSEYRLFCFHGPYPDHSPVWIICSFFCEVSTDAFFFFKWPNCFFFTPHRVQDACSFHTAADFDGKKIKATTLSKQSKMHRGKTSRSSQRSHVWKCLCDIYFQFCLTKA